MPSGAMLRGTNVMTAKLSKLVVAYPRRAAAATKAEFEIEKNESIKITPKNTGDLRRSHEVLEPTVTRHRIRCVIVVKMPYAVDVHENVNAKFKVGDAKFLEKTLYASKPFMGARIARRIEFTRDNWGSL